MITQAIKFDKNIFNVKPSQKPRPHINIHISTQSIQSVIENQIARIEILEVLVNTQTNSSLFSQSQDLSI